LVRSKELADDREQNTQPGFDPRHRLPRALEVAGCVTLALAGMAKLMVI